MYDYKKSKETIEKILQSPTKIVEKTFIPSSDDSFTYENGIKAWVGALFVDIVDSSKLFHSANEDTARIIRSFCSEIISILKDDDNYREIGIRGDCVYCVYSSSSQIDLFNIFKHAYRINTFLKMLNKLFSDYGYQNIYAGIGLGCDQDLIIKAGQSGSGINDKVWIGKALVDASHLADIANRNGISPIAMSPLFYSNIIELLLESNEQYSKWIHPHYKSNSYYYSSTVEYYHCNIIETDFNDWIEKEM